MQIDNNDETYERFMKYESWLKIFLNKELVLVKSLEDQKQETSSKLVDELNVDAEHRELYSVMNEIWWIIWNLFFTFSYYENFEKLFKWKCSSEID